MRMRSQAAGMPDRSRPDHRRDYSRQSGYNAMVKLLKIDPDRPPIFAANDAMAIGAMQAARHEGLETPQGHVVRRLRRHDRRTYDPAVDLVHQPLYEIGSLASRMLLAHIQGEPGNATRRRTSCPASLEDPRVLRPRAIVVVAVPQCRPPTVGWPVLRHGHYIEPRGRIHATSHDLTRAFQAHVRTPRRRPRADHRQPVGHDRSSAGRARACPRDVSFVDFFDLDHVAGFGVDNSPRYESKVIEETDEYIIHTTRWGATIRNWKHATSTPEFLDFTIKDRELWQAAKARMTRSDDRIPWEHLKAQLLPSWREKGRWIEAGLWFGFDVTHSWTVGTERLLMAMVEDPEWCVDMFNHFLDVQIALLDRSLGRRVHLRRVRWPDDMGYKHNQFFSLKTYRELLKPVQKRAIDWAHAQGRRRRTSTPAADVNPFVPEFVEIGLDALNPLEVKAGMDPIDLKRQVRRQARLPRRHQRRALGQPGRDRGGDRARAARDEAERRLHLLVRPLGPVVREPRGLPPDHRSGEEARELLAGRNEVAMRQARIGFIGAGAFISHIHLVTARHSPIMEIRAIADLNEDLLARHSAESPVGYTTTDYHRLLADPEVDIVVIGTKQDLHARMIVESLDAGKWVLCEKPMAQTSRGNGRGSGGRRASPGTARNRVQPPVRSGSG